MPNKPRRLLLGDWFRLGESACVYVLSFRTELRIGRKLLKPYTKKKACEECLVNLVEDEKSESSVEEVKSPVVEEMKLPAVEEVKSPAVEEIQDEGIAVGEGLNEGDCIPLSEEEKMRIAEEVRATLIIEERRRRERIEAEKDFLKNLQRRKFRRQEEIRQRRERQKLRKNITNNEIGTQESRGGTDSSLMPSLDADGIKLSHCMIDADPASEAGTPPMKGLLQSIPRQKGQTEIHQFVASDEQASGDAEVMIVASSQEEGKGGRNNNTRGSDTEKVLRKRQRSLDNDLFASTKIPRCSKRQMSCLSVEPVRIDSKDPRLRYQSGGPARGKEAERLSRMANSQDRADSGRVLANAQSSGQMHPSRLANFHSQSGPQSPLGGSARGRGRLGYSGKERSFQGRGRPPRAVGTHRRGPSSRAASTFNGSGGPRKKERKRGRQAQGEKDLRMQRLRREGAPRRPQSRGNPRLSAAAGRSLLVVSQAERISEYKDLDSVQQDEYRSAWGAAYSLEV